MKAMRLHKINEFTLDDKVKPIPKGDEILLKISACGICGSDIPRVYQLGTKVYPVTLGHEFSGIVSEVGDRKNEGLLGKTAVAFPLIPCMKCENCKTGHYAECIAYQYLGSRNDGGFAQYCLIPSKWNLVFSQNPQVKPEILALTEPLTVAQHAIRKAKLIAGESLVIVGAGPIGIMAARWAQIFGARKVILLEISDEKISFAKQRGLQVLNVKDEKLAQNISSLTNGRGVDVVIEGTGTTGGLNTAIELSRTFGRIVLVGNPQKDTMLELKNHSSILRKELQLLGIWNSYYMSMPLNEWEYTVHMLDAGRLEGDDLITHQSSLSDLKHLFDQIYHKEISACKAIYNAKLDGDELMEGKTVQ